MVISFAYLTKTFYCYSSTCSNCVDRVEESLVFSQNFPDVALTSNVYSLQPPNMQKTPLVFVCSGLHEVIKMVNSFFPYLH